MLANKVKFGNWHASLRNFRSLTYRRKKKKKRNLRRFFVSIFTLVKRFSKKKREREAQEYR